LVKFCGLRKLLKLSIFPSFNGWLNLVAPINLVALMLDRVKFLSLMIPHFSVGPIITSNQQINDKILNNRLLFIIIINDYYYHHDLLLLLLLLSITLPSSPSVLIKQEILQKTRLYMPLSIFAQQMKNVNFTTSNRHQQITILLYKIIDFFMHASPFRNIIKSHKWWNIYDWIKTDNLKYKFFINCFIPIKRYSTVLTRKLINDICTS